MIGFAERQYVLYKGATYNLTVQVERGVSLPQDLQLSVQVIRGDACKLANERSSVSYLDVNDYIYYIYIFY